MKDKSFIIKNAQKLTAKGQIDGAIAEWEKLLSSNKDASVYNTIGDLYLRKGAQNEAMESFVKAAEIFQEDGFSPKAIAIYKKILNAVPSEVHALTALGNLNEERGLLSNAAEHYRKAAETYFRNNEFHKAIEVYERIAKIIPTDMVAKVKIAELHMKMELNAKAADCYAAVAKEYFDKKDRERAHVFYNKALEADPENASTFLGLSMLEEDADNIQKAFDLASRAMSSAPGNADILAGFVRISQKAGKAEEIKNTLNRLISEDPSNMDAKRFLGYMFIKEQDTDRAWECLASCIEASVNDDKYPEAMSMLNHFLDSHTSEARTQLIKIYRAQNDTDMLITELKALAGFYESTDKRTEALELYREARTLSPEDTEIFESINNLEQALGICAPEDNMIEKGVSSEHSGAPPQDVHAPDKGETVTDDIGDRATPSSAHTADNINQPALNAPENTIQDTNELFERNELPTPPPAASGEQIIVEEDDYDSYYESGVEHKEAGRLDKAIQEFQKASLDPTKTMLSTRMIAACYLQKGVYPRAIAEFNKIIASLSPEDAGYINTKYELAVAHVSNSDFNRAVELLTEIQSQEPGFRDVEQKIIELQARTEQEVKADAHPKPKKERISYI